VPDRPKTFWPELLSKKKKKKGTYTVITLQYTPHPNQKKDKQYFGLTKFSAARHISDVSLP
jgi:hypothetical protein